MQRIEKRTIAFVEKVYLKVLLNVQIVAPSGFCLLTLSSYVTLPNSCPSTETKR
jgi:hypothetical protein